MKRLGDLCQTVKKRLNSFSRQFTKTKKKLETQTRSTSNTKSRYEKLGKYRYQIRRNYKLTKKNH